MVRFAAVGVVNTGLDMGLFLLLQPWLGIVAANFLSTSAGMTFSFLVNGRFTFRDQQATWRKALLFLATTGTTMWVLQPVVIHLLLEVIDSVALVKLLAIGVSFVANFAAYRFVVWPVQQHRTH
ncbi:GtrA family protein [Nocardioides dubius]|uniref:GtrA family protein n=1 Tax=Nocardioides dubius TaxID=317019 RepID=A0ABN1TQ53_9ACTN